MSERLAVPQAGLSPTDEARLAGAAPHRVLLVDDQPLVSEAVRRSVADQPDILYHYCAQPLEALRVAGEFQPTVLLLDLNMPEMDGFGVLRYLRAHHLWRDLPVVMLSVEEEPEVKARAFAAGANDYLIKLPSRVELLARLRHHSTARLHQLQRDAAHQELRAQRQRLDRLVAERTADLAAANQALMNQRNALRASEERLRTLVEQMPVMMYALDQEGRICAWNRESERVTGFSAEEMIDDPQGVTHLFPEAGLRERVLAFWRGEESEREREWPFTTRTGGSRTVACYNISRHCPIPGWAAWGIGVDISQRVLLERQLRQAHKLEAIGTLAGGVAHDFNNILGAIIGYTELALDDVAAESQTAANLREVFQAGLRARDLVAQLLAFSRQSRPEPRPLELTPVVKEAVRFLRATVPTSITFHTRIEEETGLVRADPTQIHQVLLNLCNNAVQAMREGPGELEVGLARRELNADRAEAFGLAPGVYVVMWVKDSGEGIPEKYRERIFDPFFTTKGVGEGTGLGLSMVHGIVTGHGGGIAVESGPEGGALFSVALPLQDQVREAHDLLDPPLPMAGNGRRVLLVDDEESLLMLGRRWLERVGYQVVAMGNPVQALAHFRQRGGDYDVVITDHVMPHMKGRDLARQMRGLQPRVPIILCTASAKLTANPKLVEDWGFAACVSKPFLARELTSAVARVLTRGSAGERPAGAGAA